MKELSPLKFIKGTHKQTKPQTNKVHTQYGPKLTEETGRDTNGTLPPQKTNATRIYLKSIDKARIFHATNRFKEW